MTICNTRKVDFARVKRRAVEAEFSGGEVTSDGGILLVQSADRYLGLTQEVARELEDPRRRNSVTHSLLSMLRQRVYGMALGNEDLNDHGTLRHDPAWQTAVGEEDALSSVATLCRFENRATRRAAVKVHQVLLKKFIDSHTTPPEELILDFADSGFCRHRMLSWCERNDVGYILGIAKNPRLLACAEELMAGAEEEFVRTGEKQRHFCFIRYSPERSWPKHKSAPFG